MECRRDLDVVGTAFQQETERHASPVCVGTGVRTKARSTSTDGALQRKPPTLPTSINGGLMSMKCRPCLRRGVITELPAAWQQSGRFECEDCAETVARKHKWTVVAFHKQGYSAFSREAARDVVKQLNPKRGGL